MKNENKFIGIVTDIINEHSFIFRSDNIVRCQIGQIVGLNISSDIYALACVEKIDVNYFLTNTEEYFTSIASENKLNELLKGNRPPKYSQRIKATFVGIYEYNKSGNHFIESNISIDSYTPNIFHEVIYFDFNSIDTVYGLCHEVKKGFKLGKFLYPNYSNKNILNDVKISTDTFRNHTLISGVTGSGKSRLTAIIANQLAIRGGHITIIDPHDEYVIFLDTKNAKVSHFSRNAQAFNDRSDIYKRNLTLTNQYLTPIVLSKLLPKISESQSEYIYEAYTSILDEFGKDITLKKIIDIIIQKFNRNYIEEGHSADILSKAQLYAKEGRDYLSFITRYIFYLNREWYSGKSKPAKAEVAFSVLKRLIDVFKDDIFPSNINNPTPGWLDFDARNTINIINIDYDSNSYVRRFVDTIIQCFFTPQKRSRILIVDEAHLLLKEKSETETSALLSRLLRESRKFNLSIIFVTQNEVDVPDEIKSQFQNKFRFREEKNEKLKYLDNQTCLCSIYKGKLDFPMRVDHIEEFIL